MDKFWETIVTVASGIIGVAIVAVIVSRKAQTPAVIQAAGSAFGNSLGVAESPVTGLGYGINLSYPSNGFFGFSPPSASGGFGF
jgi:hypothetical protein